MSVSMERGNRSDCLHILAIEPYFQGSHQAFLEDVGRCSRHRWTLLQRPGVHWKWRMRSAPLDLANESRHVLRTDRPDVLFCSEMLDLPTWRGLVREPGCTSIPALVYFHENQWTYPRSPQARVDHHYGYTNLLTAIAADACAFNSAFHRDEFLDASESFVRRMPDAGQVHDLDAVRNKSIVIYPGFAQPLSSHPIEHAEGPIRIGWVHRWEHDKRPDRFLQLLDKLSARHTPFELVLLGARPRGGNASLDQIRARFAAQIGHDAYATDGPDYWNCLRRMDVVVSTADHEFFGIAVCEAVAAGAAAVVPNRLSYPELFPADATYHSLSAAADKIAMLNDRSVRDQRARDDRAAIASLTVENGAASLDHALARLSASPTNRT